MIERNSVFILSCYTTGFPPHDSYRRYVILQTGPFRLSWPRIRSYITQRSRRMVQQPKRLTDLVYSPFLDMLTTESDTMKTEMVEAQYLTELTGQKWTILTCDQQLYKEVKHVNWN